VHSALTTKIIFAPEVSDDFDRILAHLNLYDASDTEGRIADILLAIDILERNPLIGRPTGDGLSELIVGRDTRGYVVLYRYAKEIDTVFVLGVRSQREAGYTC
jgi:toxin ParE1/3/4